VAEDDRTVERVNPESGSDRAGVEDTDPDSTADTDPDSAAASFFELDDQLDRSTGPDPVAGLRRGLVVDAGRVDATAVPEGYPLDARTDEAVALTVDFGTETTTVYLAWPETGETALTRLLDAKGVTLADLYGERVLVDRREGHDALVTPAEAPRGSDWRGAILAGLGVVAGFLALATVAVAGAGLLWVLVTLVGLPYAVYRDAWYTRTHSDWRGGPLFWATLAALPMANLLTVPVYLWRRSRATFFAERPSLVDRAVSAVRSWL
jgi:hypothetical protein